jgi:tetratricopeptide (TPR) repeat protein
MGSSFLERINVRFLAILVGIGIAILILVIIVHKVQESRHAGYFLTQADELAANEEITERQKAVDGYAKYLGLRNDDTEVRIKLAFLLKDLGMIRMAIDSFERILRDDPTQTESRREVVDLYISPFVSRYSDAKDHLETLLASDSENIETLNLIGQCEVAQEKFVEAENHFRQVLKKDPSMLTAYTNLANILKNNLSRSEEAQKLLDDMVKANPKSADAYLKRGSYLLNDKKIKLAAADVKKAIELDPKNYLSQLLAADCAIAEDKPSEAISYARKAIELDPEKNTGYVRQGQVYQYMKKPLQALQAFDDGLKKTNNSAEILWYKADLLLTLEKKEEAKAAIETLSRSAIAPPLVEFLQARLDFINNKWLDASRKFEQVRSALAGTRAWAIQVQRSNAYLAFCYARLGRPELEKQARERSGQIVGSSKQAAKVNSYLKAIAFVRKGDLDSAIAEYNRVLATDKATGEGWILLTQALIAKQLQNKDETARDWTEVNKSVVKVAEYLPGDPRVSNLMARILSAKNQMKGAEGELRSMLRDTDDEFQKWRTLSDKVKHAADAKAALAPVDEALTSWGKDNEALLNVKTNLEQDQLNKAVALLGKTITRKFTRSQLWGGLINMSHSKGDFDQAELVLDEATKDMGDKPSLRLARGQIWVDRDPEEAAKKLKTLAENTDSFTEKEKQLLWYNLAMIMVNSGEVKEAVELCQKVAAGQPGNLPLREQLYEICLKAENREAAQKTLDEIEKIEGKGPHWYYLKAVGVAYGSEKDKERNQEAIQLLEKAREKRPTWEKVPRVLGRIYDKLGNHEAAVDEYSRAIDLGLQEPEILDRLVQLMSILGRDEEASRFIGMIGDTSQGITYQTIFFRAREKFRKGDKTGGIKDMQQVTATLKEIVKTSKDPFDSIRLSDALMLIASANAPDSPEAKKNNQDAIKVLRDAIDKDPASFELWNHLIRRLQRLGDKAELEKLITLATKKADKKIRPLVLADCYTALENKEKALAEYSKAIKESPKDIQTVKRMIAFLIMAGELKQAEEVLNGLNKSKDKIAPEDFVWVRRTLASLKFDQGSPKERKEAIALIDENLKNDPNSLADKRVMAFGLSRKGTHEDRKKSETLLIELTKIPNPSDKDRYLLAKLLLMKNNWSEASQLFQSLMAADNIKPEWLNAYIRAMIKRGEFNDAQRLLDQYRKMIPNDFHGYAIQAMLDAGRGQTDKAIDDLKAYIDSDKAKPSSKSTRVRLAAQSAEKIADQEQLGSKRAEAVTKLLDQAEVWLREEAKSNPVYRMNLASFLAKRGEYPESISLAEQNWRLNRPANIAMMSGRLASSGNPPEEIMKRLEELLNKSLVRYRQDPAILLAKAELRMAQGNNDEAEKFFRKVLEKQPNNIVALNNMSVFLALQGKELDEALKMINQAIESNGPIAALMDSRATVYMARGETEAALEDLEFALSEEPSPVRYFHQAQALLQNGEKQKAAVVFEQAKKIGLNAEKLQTIERPAYEKLEQELKE